MLITPGMPVRVELAAVGQTADGFTVRPDVIRYRGKGVSVEICAQCDERHTALKRLVLNVARKHEGNDAMEAPISEYRREAARLRPLIAHATTATARQHLEEQVCMNERFAACGKRDVFGQAA
jgi:hypothetical protein